MKLSLLGATGQTGQYLLAQALQQGHEVTAVVRKEYKITIVHDNLKVVKANIFSADSLAEHFQGQDAIFSCLGFRHKVFSGITGYANSMVAIVTAMRQSQVNRLVVMTSWYTDPDSRGQDSTCMLRSLLFRGILNNMYEMEEYLEKECSDLNWTVVRPPTLYNMPPTEKEFATHEGYYVPDTNALPAANRIYRGDVARFMLSQLHSDEWTRKAVAMCTL